MSKITDKEKMIYISGSLEDVNTWYGAEEYIRSGNAHNKVPVINIVKALQGIGELSDSDLMEIRFLLLSKCNTIYMLKGWETDLVARAEHEYAYARHYNIIYSKKF